MVINFVKLELVISKKNLKPDQLNKTLFFFFLAEQEEDTEVGLRRGCRPTREFSALYLDLLFF
jgi:hypothetical protein